MSWVAWLLFESPTALGGALFVDNFVLLVIWRRTGHRRPLVVGLALAAGLLLIQTLVVTRREQAARILKRIERDVLTAQTTALAQCLAPDFRADGMGAQDFVEFVARRYEWVRVRSLSQGRVEVQESQPDSFVVEVPYRADVVVEQYAGLVRTRWRITLHRTDQGWRIRHVQPTYIEGLVNPSWDRIDGF